ncbi:hypothetical protein HA402_012651, partial [Bradysia odoriphaga]
MIPSSHSSGISPRSQIFTISSCNRAHSASPPYLKSSPGRLSDPVALLFLSLRTEALTSSSHDNEYVHNAEMQHLFIFNGKLKDSTNPLRMRDVKINYFTKNLDDTAMQAGHYKFIAMCNGIHLQ